LKLRKKIEKLLEKNIAVFKFDSDTAELREFIQKNIFSGNRENAKSRITKNNFPHIFYKWVKEVKPTINISADRWRKYKKEGILDGDFFIADMMSKDGTSIAERILIVLENNKYKLKKEIAGDLFKFEIGFTDGGGAYTRFWNRYERPPAEEYRQYIIGRRDLLVPQNIREVKGSFYTPAIWVEKSQEYLEKVFGPDWQEEYYIWDCAAGTGNLLAGLTNKNNIWASDIDAGNINTIRELIDGGLNLWTNHIFQFDFLNDDFKKLPAELKKIVDDPEKCRKLIIYINPPYAETMSKGIRHKAGLHKTKINEQYALRMGNSANREIFIQFLSRIYVEIPDCIIATFSTLKTLNAPHFNIFRSFFLARLLKLFIVPADTFDNVKGKFPIGFQIWDTGIKEKFDTVNADIFDENGNLAGQKIFCCYDNCQFINEWLITTRNRENEKAIGFMACLGNDFQQINVNFIMNDKSQMSAPRGSWVTDKNLVEVCIYLSVRHCISSTWINNRDQFLFPNDGWKKDIEFQNDCLINTLFHNFNNISCKYGVNHWIPFTEKAVAAKEKFESNFMSSFLKGKAFSEEAQAVLSAGKALWKYFHEKTKNNKTISVNASFYDIREFFQGRKESGAMNVKSADEDYTALLKALRDALKALARKVEPKVYAYGFLKE
jgi:hypothetical protein